MSINNSFGFLLNILNKVTGDIAKQIARQSASSQLGGGAEAEGFNKKYQTHKYNYINYEFR